MLILCIRIFAVSVLEFSEKDISLVEQKKALENKIIQNTVEIERLAKWGDVNPEDFANKIFRW